MSNKRPKRLLAVILLGALTLVGCTNQEFFPTSKKTTSEDPEVTTEKEHTKKTKRTKSSSSDRTTKKDVISNEINFYSWSDEYQGAVNTYYGGFTNATDEDGKTINIGKKVSSCNGNQTLLKDGTKINWHIYHDALTTDYMDALDEALENGTCDMYYVEEGIASKYITSDYVTDMSLLGLDQSHQFQYTKDAVTIPYTNKVVGTMFYANPGTIMYNYEMAKEIFGSNITTSDMDDMLSTDYDTLINTCDIVTNYGYKIMPSIQDTFLQYSCNTTIDMFNPLNNTITIDKNYFKWAVDTKQLSSRNYFYTTTSQWDSEWARAVGSDNCFLSLSCNWFADWSFRDYYCANHNMDYNYPSSFDSGWRITKGVMPWYWGGTWVVVNPIVLNNTNKKNTISDILIDITTDKERAKEISRTKTLHSYTFTNHIDAMEELEIENPWTDNFYGGQNLYKIYNDAIEGISVDKGMYNYYISTYIYGALRDYIVNLATASVAFNILRNNVINQTFITDVLIPDGVTIGNDIIIE